MHQHTFIPITVTEKDGKNQVRYVNTAHIQQVYEADGVVFIELSGYDVLEVRNENINVFMDRFVR
jgi:hypothetical protein